MPMVKEILLPDSDAFPNSALPALAYRAAIPAGPDNAAAFERLFIRHGWHPAWRDTIYAEHHFHSTAHECLGIASGRVRVQLGGPDGPDLELQAGDVLVIPAGVAHCKIESSPDLEVVGAYPPGQSPDMLRGRAGERPRADERIAQLGLPTSDPVEGRDGSLPRRWKPSIHQVKHAD